MMSSILDSALPSCDMTFEAVATIHQAAVLRRLLLHAVLPVFVGGAGVLRTSKYRKFGEVS